MAKKKHPRVTVVACVTSPSSPLFLVDVMHPTRTHESVKLDRERVKGEREGEREFPMIYYRRTGFNMQWSGRFASFEIEHVIFRCETRLYSRCRMQHDLQRCTAAALQLISSLDLAAGPLYRCQKPSQVGETDLILWVTKGVKTVIVIESMHQRRMECANVATQRTYIKF